jgi:penicillin-binding protein 1B
MARKTTRSSITQVLRRRDWLLAKIFAGAGVVLVAALLWSIWPYWQLSGRFEGLPTHWPSRLYGRAFRLAPGLRLGAGALVARLEDLSYHKAAGELGPGTFHRTGDEVAVFRRRFPNVGADHGGDLLVVRFDGDRLIALARTGRPVAEAWLDPPLLATFPAPDLVERWPTPLAEIPDPLVRAVLAAEDAGFFEHPGISLTGIARALFANLRGGEVTQGGSTLTQQLAKNLYLSSERTMSRKLREATLAVMLEWRYSKQQILEAYLNQIYWGKSGTANLAGIGAAARAYCGKSPEELTLAESALLAGMIQAPARYLPGQHPEAAKTRRDFVLRRLAELEWAPAADVEAALAEPLPGAPVLGRNRAPFFAAAAAEEVAARWKIGELTDQGLTLLSTLDVLEQRAAEAAITAGLGALAEKSERVRKRDVPLEAALVALDPASGGITAYVGGRDFRASQFDRAGDARRQVGSAFKPIVYASAFENGTATPATLLEDAPLTVELPNGPWTPSNDDDSFRGWVTARTAVEQSLNVPTVRLALATGLEKIVATARALGVTARLQPVPAVALGAFEVSPVEMATAYATLGRQGVRPPVHRIDAVLDAAGRPLPGEPLPAPAQVLSRESAFLVTAILQGVMDYGTGRPARALGLTDPVAGKTGTSNSKRDSWFVGIAPERAAVVWVGYDDDRPTPFSGSKAALPIWTAFMKAVRPSQGFGTFPQPPGIRVVLIDPASGGLATERCPDVLAEAFRDGTDPTALCRLHATRLSHAIDPNARVESPPEREGGFRGWLRRLLGHRKEPAEGNGPPP